MITFDKVIERFKASINHKNREVENYNGKKMAHFLNITATNYASMKARERIPYKNIIDYCNKNQLDLNYIFEDDNDCS